jgi:hypothetical protein
LGTYATALDWLKILNPTGEVLSRNAVAESFTKIDTNLVPYFDDLTDRLDFGDTPYRDLNFKSRFVQFMKGSKFGYLQPTQRGIAHSYCEEGHQCSCMMPSFLILY